MSAEVDGISFVERLVNEGRKVGIFSCEDPYNTPFHTDLLNASKGYLHLVPKAGGIIVPESLDIGLQAKGINAWGVFSHYGNVHGHEVCAAIRLTGGDFSSAGSDLQRYLNSLREQFTYDSAKSLEENVKRWIKMQYDRLIRGVEEKLSTQAGAVQGDVVVFGGVVYNSKDGKSYHSEILFEGRVEK